MGKNDGVRQEERPEKNGKIPESTDGQGQKLALRFAILANLLQHDDRILGKEFSGKKGNVGLRAGTFRSLGKGSPVSGTDAMRKSSGTMG
jgi:hypothetical protein